MFPDYVIISVETNVFVKGHDLSLKGTNDLSILDQRRNKSLLVAIFFFHFTRFSCVYMQIWVFLVVVVLIQLDNFFLAI